LTAAEPERRSDPPAARLAGVVKRFGATIANDRVDFAARAGEIHALLGENGAGKSTLMNILAGVYSLDAGSIELFGRPMRFRSPRAAIRAGVGMVHQHFALVPSRTVAQNLALADPDGPVILRKRVIEARVRELCGKFGLALDPAAVVGDLSVGEQQRLELLRMLAHDARVLVLDEPTAVLTPHEAAELFALMRKLAGAGRALVFITHKLDEVEACADRLTVLRRGRVVVADRPVAGCRRDEIAAWMVGRESLPAESFAPSAPGAVVLELRGVCADIRGAHALREVNLAVRAGEIVAIAGVAGNGQPQLAEAIMGLRPLRCGVRRFGGVDATKWATPQLRAAGVGFVPEDRLDMGVCAKLSLADNLNLRAAASAAPFLLDAAALRAKAGEAASSMHVVYDDLDAPIRSLSGGNIQRAILAREIVAGLRLLIVAQPTRGLDIAASAAVHAVLRQRRQAGAAILLISYDLDEIYELADRVAVMARGRIVAEYARPLPDRATLGLAMTGGGADAA
jgi:simple sugar transport system ATP-binding protein